MEKIKVFLGAYPNFLNAQNINVRSLSEHLSREKFEIGTMLYPVQNAKDFKKLHDVRYFQQYRPHRWLSWWGYLRGLMWADVAFLPKFENERFCKWIATAFGTKLFTTVEGLIGDTDLSKMSKRKGRTFIEHFKWYEPHLYAITKFLSHEVGKRRGYHFSDKILYLGVESSAFLNKVEKVKTLQNIVFIGNKLPTKNIEDFIEASRLYPQLQFHIVGDSLMRVGTIQEYIKQAKLQNVTYHGRMDHQQLRIFLEEMDLMYFPSRSEGFPKVMLETACAGVPTLCYGDYGAEEWITTGENGFVVDTKQEAFEIIARLQQSPTLLQSVSRNAVLLGKRFDWSSLVKDWEEVIENVYQNG